MDGEMGEVSDEGIALVQRWDGVMSIEEISTYGRFLNMLGDSFISC
jgi:hypothetical protein